MKVKGNSFLNIYKSVKNLKELFLLYVYKEIIIIVNNLSAYKIMSLCNSKTAKKMNVNENCIMNLCLCMYVCMI